MPTRRRVLVGVAGITLGAAAGCSRESAPRETTYVPPDVVVFNKTDGETRATVSVESTSGDESFVDQTVTIESKGAAEFRDALPSEATVVFAVDVQDGPSGKREFSVTGEDESIQAVVGDGIGFRKR